MKKIHWGVVLAGVGLAALILTAMGNPANMGFCIACFLRDTAGACGLHSAAKVQYVRPEIIGLVLGAFLMSVAGKEFKACAGSHRPVPAFVPVSTARSSSSARWPSSAARCVWCSVSAAAT